MSTKFSGFTSKNFDSIDDLAIRTTINLVGVDETNDINFKINYLELLADATNIGSGSSVFKEITDLKTFNFRKIKAGSTKVTITEGTDDISIDIDPSVISLGDLTSTLGIDNGGTGTSLTDPEADRIMFWDDSAGEITWLSIGAGLDLTGTTLSVDLTSPLSTKGDLFVHNGTDDARLPVGTNGYVLVADSSEATGLKWESPLSTSDLGKIKVDSDATLDYLGNTNADGVLRLGSNKLSYTDGGGFITLDIVETNIDLDNCDNSSSNFIKEHTMFQNLQTSGYAITHTEDTSPVDTSFESTGLTMLNGNFMHYYNDVANDDAGIFDLVISRNQLSTAHEDYGARLLLEKRSNTVDVNDPLGEIWFSSNDSAATDTIDGATGIVGYAVAQHDSSNRGGWLSFKARRGTGNPSTAADEILSLNKNNTQEAIFASTIQTTSASITDSAWAFGQFNSEETIGGTTGTIEVEIDGTVYYITAGTTSS